MMNNPDILMRACNETFGTDGAQQQYYVQSTPVPTSSVYLPQQHNNTSRHKYNSYKRQQQSCIP